VYLWLGPSFVLRPGLRLGSAVSGQGVHLEGWGRTFGGACASGWDLHFSLRPHLMLPSCLRLGPSGWGPCGHALCLGLALPRRLRLAPHTKARAGLGRAVRGLPWLVLGRLWLLSRVRWALARWWPAVAGTAPALLGWPWSLSGRLRSVAGAGKAPVVPDSSDRCGRSPAVRAPAVAGWAPALPGCFGRWAGCGCCVACSGCCLARSGAVGPAWTLRGRLRLLHCLPRGGPRLFPGLGLAHAGRGGRSAAVQDWVAVPWLGASPSAGPVPVSCCEVTPFPDRSRFCWPSCVWPFWGGDYLVGNRRASGWWGCLGHG